MHMSGCRKLNSAAVTLLRGYVDAFGRTLTIAVRRSMEATDWLNHREPRAPRLVCDFILDKMTGDEDGCMEDWKHSLGCSSVAAQDVPW